MPSTSVYDEQYYATSCGPLRYERSDHWIRFFGQTADELIRALRPSRVFDAGCAMGFLVESFWDRGVFCEGVDVSEYAINHVRRDMVPYCKVRSLTEPIEGRFDLVTCIEVLEHIPAGNAGKVIENLCGAADTIFFSSTPTDLDEPTHLNVEPTKYWLDLFAKNGFGPDPYVDGGFLTPHAFVARKGLRTEEPVLRLFCEYIRLKMALQASDIAKTAAQGQSADLQQALEAARKEKLVKIDELAAARDELGSVREAAEGFQRALTMARERIDQLEPAEAKLQAVERELADCRMTLDKVLHSVSWKVTRPFRAVRSVVRGGSHSGRTASGRM